VNNASRSILVFGVYIVVSGLTLIFAPNMLLGLLGLPATSEVWIRGMGVLGIVLGLYYVQAARDNNVAFFRMTFWGRVAFMLGISALGLLTPGYAVLTVFGLIDLVGAIYTWITLRQEAQVSVQMS
jgi:hypothetical protein